MKIAIIGTGNVGGALASQWAKAGHQIILGIRDTNDFKGKYLLENANTSAANIQKAVAKSDVVCIATPPQIVLDLIENLGELSGKVIIDASNSLRIKPDPYPTAFHAFEALTKADLVKCFNTTGFENMKDPNYGNQKLDMFMAGNSKKAKEIAKQLSIDAGFGNCYDFGKSEKVELLEQFALCWINLAIYQGMGRDFGFKIVTR